MTKLLTNLFLLAMTFVCFEGAPGSPISNVCVDPSSVMSFATLNTTETAGAVVVQLKDGTVVGVKGSLEEVRKSLTK